MAKLNFNTDEELHQYLLDNNLTETIMFVEPTYVKAIIELSNDQRLVFNYDKMVETLADDYRSYGNDEDPIETAMEWINTNIGYIGPKTPFIVYEKPIEGLDEELLPIEDAIIGITVNDEVLIDADLSENLQSFFDEVVFI